MDETEAARHRVGKAWKVFHKWRDVLQGKEANLSDRLSFWQNTCGSSMVWGLETTRGSRRVLKITRTAQVSMVIRPLKKRYKAS